MKKNKQSMNKEKSGKLQCVAQVAKPENVFDYTCECQLLDNTPQPYLFYVPLCPKYIAQTRENRK